MLTANDSIFMIIDWLDKEKDVLQSIPHCASRRFLAQVLNFG